MLGSSSKYHFKIATVVERGISVFGGLEEFNGWLSQSNISLGDQKPVDLLSTRSGITLVEDALAAMEFGNAL
jgi:putative toxin-antitoxin system antitoxin component (TIGR02293 family)